MTIRQEKDLEIGDIIYFVTKRDPSLNLTLISLADNSSAFSNYGVLKLQVKEIVSMSNSIDCISPDNPGLIFNLKRDEDVYYTSLEMAKNSARVKGQPENILKDIFGSTEQAKELNTDINKLGEMLGNIFSMVNKNDDN